MALASAVNSCGSAYIRALLHTVVGNRDYTEQCTVLHLCGFPHTLHHKGISHIVECTMNIFIFALLWSAVWGYCYTPPPLSFLSPLLPPSLMSSPPFFLPSLLLYFHLTFLSCLTLLSAGLGRTGAFILTDILIDEVELSDFCLHPFIA